VIEPSSRTTLRANELAIPIRGSDVLTERISESDRIQFALAAVTPAPAARWTPRVTRGAVGGLVLTTLVFGILLTTTLKRPWRYQGTRLLSLHFMAKAPEPSAEPSPPPLPLVKPIVAAVAPDLFDLPPRHHGISKSARGGRFRSARTIQNQQPTGAAATESPESSPVAPPPVAKWVDPFAE
jgi:hypothetical protein